MDQDNLRKMLTNLLLENQFLIVQDSHCLQKLRRYLVDEPDRFFADDSVYLSDVIRADKAKRIYVQRLEIAKKNNLLGIDFLEKIVDFFSTDSSSAILHLRINCDPYDIYLYFGYSNNELKLIYQTMATAIAHDKFLEVYKHNSY